MRPSRPTLYRALAKSSSEPGHLSFRPYDFQHRPRVQQRLCPSLSYVVRRQRSTSKYLSIPQSSVERIATHRAGQSRGSDKSPHVFTVYSNDERAELAKKYSLAQLASIDAGEAAISDTDLAAQGKLRRDQFQFQYLDDFSRIEQIIDKKPERLERQRQDYEDAEGHPVLPHSLSTFVKVATAEHQAEIENVGEWVPGRPFDQASKEQLHEGPLTKRRLQRTAHQIAKAALKEYLGTATVQEAIEFCWRKDIHKFEEDESRFTVQLADDEDAGSVFDKGLPKLDLGQLPVDTDRPLKSAYFESTILPSQRYQEILHRIQERPPRPRHFGTPLVEAKMHEIFDPPMPDVAPEIPKIDDPSVRWASPADVGSKDTFGLEDEAIAAYQRLSKATGQTIAQLRKYRVKTIARRRVVNQTRLGKIPSMYYLCVAGDEKGMVGIGEAKATEMDEAGRTARLNAIRNMVPILRFENRTIYGEVSAKVGAAQVKLSARQPGFGLRTSQHVFEIAKCAGLLDLSARVTRSRNPMNVAKAVWQALKEQKNPEDIARSRGRKLVDVRKVYYSGLV